MSSLSLTGVVAAALMAVMTPAPASAVTYDKLAELTFSGPVQIPGVTLNLVSESPDAPVTIPDSRMSITEDAVVTFKETPAGVAPAVKSLFYGGEYRGYEFVYPKGGPIKIAKVAPQPAVTHAPLAAAPVAGPIVEPESSPAPAVSAEPLPLLEPAPQREPAPQPEPTKLPRTASPLPLLAVGGLTSLLVGLGLGLHRRRSN